MQFIADGVFYAELNELLTRELAEEGYSGVEVRVTPTRQEIIIRATRTQNVLGEKGKRIRELTAVVQKRFNFPEGSVELYAEKIANRGLSAIAQAESLRYKLLGGLAVRRACYGVLRFIMESGAKGCEVIVSGKLRAARAKSMKFVDGFMVHSGQPTKDYVDRAVRHVLLRQGMRATSDELERAGLGVGPGLGQGMWRGVGAGLGAGRGAGRRGGVFGDPTACVHSDSLLPSLGALVVRRAQVCWASRLRSCSRGTPPGRLDLRSRCPMSSLFMSPRTRPA